MAEGTGEEMLENAVKAKGYNGDDNECWQCNFNKQKAKQESECGNEDNHGGGPKNTKCGGYDGDGNECWQCNFNKQKVKQENECGDKDR